MSRLVQGDERRARVSGSLLCGQRGSWYNQEVTIFDISPPVSVETATWPGDTPFRVDPRWTTDDGAVNVARLTLSAHTGAHADAPFHYDPEGETIDAVGLEPYLGRCRVVDVSSAGNPIPAAVAEELPSGVRRVLLFTGRSPDRSQWPEHYAAVSSELVDALGHRGVQLLGVDTPSLDPVDARQLHAHEAARRHRMAILEELVLDEVPPGDWELIALPLRLVGADASPVRAVLRSLQR